MVKLTRTEIRWLIQSLNQGIDEAQKAIETEDINGFEKRILSLGVENRKCVVEKLQFVLDNKNKRIEVKDG